MESSSWPESLPSRRIKAIQELTKGEIITKKLHAMIGRPENIESDLKLQILGMFENTLQILGSSNINKTPHNPTNDHVRSPSSKDDQKSEDSAESINTKIPLKTKRGCYKRRFSSSATAATC
ncbi:hypothetical protein L1987_21717 [Smallanthus sonchifolius]|uniref:Uncharacterized protein n=1 Tax=Smallanthus sonchifolius TaxID=185202 RepID=A0ACB9ICV8_9ASTR|nr:hypothetical protein L1987_21717 [Smallanthus sonchifolius]